MGAKRDSPVSLAMTHIRWLHSQSGRESTDFTVCGPLPRLVESLARRQEPGPSSTSARTRTWTEVNVRHQSFVQQTGKEKEKAKERKSKREKLKTRRDWAVDACARVGASMRVAALHRHAQLLVVTNYSCSEKVARILYTLFSHALATRVASATL